MDRKVGRRTRRSKDRERPTTSFPAKHYVRARMSGRSSRRDSVFVVRREFNASEEPAMFSKPNPAHSTIRHAVGALVLLAVASPLAAQRVPRLEVSGIPALNFDADEGIGYGAIVALYQYQPGATAYQWTLQPTLFMTSRGRRDYTLFFDAPSRVGHPWRLTAYAGREQQLAAPYYGIGNETPFDAAVETGSTRYFYRYGLDRLRASADVQHTVGSPSLRYLIGAGATADKLDLTPFDSGTTLIQHDLGARQPPTSHVNYIRAGLTWDTRDREIGTRSG